jgi:hypothetical protein
VILGPGANGWTRRGFSRRAGLRTNASRETSIGYCFSGTKLHERDRLKYVGGRGEEQAAKVVRNGEGGTKRVWKPATRNRVFRESSPGHLFREVVGMRATRSIPSGGENFGSNPTVRWSTCSKTREGENFGSNPTVRRSNSMAWGRWPLVR